MSEERTMVLKMLKDGKITVEEAEALLDALEGSSEERAEREDEERLRRPRAREEREKRIRIRLGGGREFDFPEFEEGVSEAVREAEEVAREAVEEAEEVARETAQRVKEAAREAAQRARVEAESTRRQAKDFKKKFKFKGKKDMFGNMFEDMFSGNWLNLDHVFNNIFGTTKFVDTKGIAVPIEGAEKLLLKNIWGDIKVSGAETAQIKIKAKITVWGPDEETSQGVARSLQIKTSHIGNEFMIEAEAPGAPEHKRYRIDYDLEAPRRMSLDLSSKSGDISAYEIEGNLTLVTLSGDLETDRIKGAMRLNTKSGDIRATHTEGDLDLGSFSGDVRLVDVKGNIKSATKSGDVKAEDVNGNLTANTLSGDVEALRVSGNLQAESTSGDVQLKDCQGEIRVKAFSGDVEMNRVLSNRLDASSLSGDVKAEVTLSENGIITMESTSGNVSLKIPESTKAEVVAGTASGNIHCGIALSSVQKDKKSLRGVLNSPEGKIELSSKSGNVSIDTLTEVG